MIERTTEYWYWSDETTLGAMTVSRDENGRFNELHYYTPIVVKGEMTEAGEMHHA